MLSWTSLLFPCLLFSKCYCKFMRYFLNFNKGLTYEDLLTDSIFKPYAACGAEIFSPFGASA
ncbi:hypothetical protein Barb4_03994 [Bacteroidales bacterium Barb4]|nr:hypothetical protein Barb4_03994 [Bacteroidales bacterium Barb4]